MKCFEIKLRKGGKGLERKINRKHEMFWNLETKGSTASKTLINRKHEMFWNVVTHCLECLLFAINRKHEMFWNHLESEKVEPSEN